MKIIIKYHESGREIINLVETDAKNVHTRGVYIQSILTFAGNITIYPNQLPARIDKQYDTIMLLDCEFVKQYPKPYGLFSNTDFFGKPETIWKLSENEISK